MRLWISVLRRWSAVALRIARASESLDALRGPLGADLGAGDAPDLLGVGLEEDLIQPLAEAVADHCSKLSSTGDGQKRAWT